MVSFKGDITFINNTGRQGGAISAYNAHIITFESNITFIGNSAILSGGAISWKEGSVIDLQLVTQVMFKTNAAAEYGGAIYVEDDGLRDGKDIKCFIETETYYGLPHYEVE